MRNKQASRTPVGLVDKMRNLCGILPCLSSSKQFGKDKDSGRCEKVINRTDWGKVSLSPSLQLVLCLGNIPYMCLEEGREVGRAGFTGVGPAQSLWTLGLMPWFPVLHFSIIFEHGTSHLPFALGPQIA